MSRKLLLAAIAALAVGASPSLAQDFTLDPTFGEVTLEAGFVPDPHTVEIVAGGDIDAFDAIGTDGLGNSCVGTIANAPDYRLQYTSGSFPLIFSFVSDGDTTLVVNAPDGSWYCDDDSGGSLNPMIEFATPMSGQYDIWVGAFGGGNPTGTLSISEVGGMEISTPPPSAPVGGPDFGLDPAFGEATLAAGFTPDPHSVDVVAGGPIDAYEAIGTDAAGNGCFGLIAEAPDYRIQYTAGGFPLIISAVSAADATLVVNDPNGNWYCNDDSEGTLNPTVTFDAPLTGQYDIWVGALGGGNPDATLSISELASTAGNNAPGGNAPGSGVGMPDFALAPTFGEVALTAGFVPDPHTVDLVAGGPIDATTAIGTDGLGNSCIGMIAEAPDFRLQYTPGNFDLTIRVEAAGDTTLVINGPDGTWYCNDDGAGYPNPEVTFANPMGGQYDIWVGTYGGGNPDATLNITEVN
jgi:hypothetical protein